MTMYFCNVLELELRVCGKTSVGNKSKFKFKKKYAILFQRVRENMVIYLNGGLIPTS